MIISINLLINNKINLLRSMYINPLAAGFLRKLKFSFYYIFDRELICSSIVYYESL